MKIIETPVYEFDELNDKAKEKAREWFKQGMENEDHWKEYVYEDATTIASLMGIEIKNIYFSGFWSQGDGACFEGSFNASDIKAGKVKEHAPLDEELNKIANEFERLASNHPRLSFTTTHRGRYYHENSVDFEFNDVDNMDNDIDVAYELQDELKEVAKDLMRWIYKQLEKAYDYENSNENVDENIRINEYTFTGEGKRFG